jgi:DHA2 family multidrug resistance protein
VRALVGIGAVLLGTFTATLNSRLTDIGLADIRGAFGLGFDEASWITTAYVVAEVAAIPAAIWLRGILSPARGVLLGSLLFTLLSLLAPLSPSLPVLLGFQALRGLSAGILIPMTYAVVIRHLPQHLRLYGLSVYAMVSAFTPSLAIYIEAWVLNHLSWEYLFWLNVIPGALTLFAGAYGLNRDPIKFLKFRRHDGFGLLALSLGLATLAAALDQGNRLDWLSSGLIAGLLASGLTLIAAFFIHAMLHHDPVVNPRLLWRGNTGLGLFVMFISRIALVAPAFLVPQYLSRIQGYRSLESGGLFLASGLPLVVLAPLTAWLCYRLDPRNILALGVMLTGASILMMTQLTSLWAATEIWPLLLLQSAAGPLLAVPMMVVISESISIRDIAWVSALVHIVRTLGTSIALAVTGTLVRVQEQAHSNLIGQHLDKGSIAVQNRLNGLSSMIEERSSTTADTLAQATILLARAVRREAFVMAYADAFLAVGLVVLVSSLALLLIRRPALPGKFF